MNEMKIEDRVQELENKVFELEKTKQENKVMKEAIAFLLNKSKFKNKEAFPFRNLFPEWSPDGTYPMHSYITHGTD